MTGMTKNVNIDPNDDENNNGGVNDDDERFSRRTLADTVTLICVFTLFTIFTAILGWLSR